jgi:uncharacterized protein (TIGR02246 family)
MRDHVCGIQSSRAFSQAGNEAAVRGPRRQEQTMNPIPMNAKLALRGASALALLIAGQAWADDIRAVMEADNARWLGAYNSNNPSAFPAMYAKDAVVLPPGAPAVNGREAIGRFWEDRLKPGNRKDHTFEITNVRQEGNVAYQVAHWTLKIVKEGGDVQPLQGNTVRVFERQQDGTWLTKVHMFNLQ